MKKQDFRFQYLLLMLVFLSACSSGQTLVETTWIVAEKNEKNGKYLITTNKFDNRMIKDFEITSEEIWRTIEVGTSITFRYKDGEPYYLKAINNVPTYSELTGEVKSKLQDNGNHFIIVGFQQIGEELIRVDEPEWNNLSEGQFVRYSIDSWGGVNQRLE